MILSPVANLMHHPLYWFSLLNLKKKMTWKQDMQIWICSKCTNCLTYCNLESKSCHAMSKGLLGVNTTFQYSMFLPLDLEVWVQTVQGEPSNTQRVSKRIKRDIGTTTTTFKKLLLAGSTWNLATKSELTRYLISSSIWILLSWAVLTY